MGCALGARCVCEWECLSELEMVTEIVTEGL